MFKKHNVNSLEELVQERTKQLWQTNRSDSDEVWAVEADIRRVQELTMERVRLANSRISLGKWSEHLGYMATQLGSHAPKKDGTCRTSEDFRVVQWYWSTQSSDEP